MDMEGVKKEMDIAKQSHQSFESRVNTRTPPFPPVSEWLVLLLDRVVAADEGQQAMCFLGQKLPSL